MLLLPVFHVSLSWLYFDSAKILAHGGILGKRRVSTAHLIETLSVGFDSNLSSQQPNDSAGWAHEFSAQALHREQAMIELDELKKKLTCCRGKGEKSHVDLVRWRLQQYCTSVLFWPSSTKFFRRSRSGKRALTNDLRVVAAFVHANMGSFIAGGFTVFAALSTTGAVIYDNHRGQRIGDVKREIHSKIDHLEKEVKEISTKISALNSNLVTIEAAIMKARNGDKEHSLKPLRGFTEACQESGGF
ncbi:hypothetical protein HOY82DRAFT_592693 [Tuber indicum]|nr:hypothetical protein HOY82DRAFT_592693 [Tuber indicum]